MRALVRRSFWQPDSGARSVMKPDLLLSLGDTGPQLVIDAKWKLPDRGHPADDDLRQVFADLHGFEASRGVLVDPAAGSGQAARTGMPDRLRPSDWVLVRKTDGSSGAEQA